VKPQKIDLFFDIEETIIHPRYTRITQATCLVQSAIN